MTTDPNFQLPPHIELIDKEIVEAIAAAEQGGSKHPQILLVAVPPRHGKSSLISVFTPAWYLGLFPERQVMLASYEADFAASWGGRAREVLAEHGRQLFGVSLSNRARSARRWELASGGRMISAGVGGPLTGQGAHLMIIDDPVKNAEAAMSEVMRERQWEWWLSTARTRLEPGAVVLVLMTRWHDADLGGRLLKEEGDPVREIRLPALAEVADPLGRKPGAPLWPVRFSQANLEETRKTIGPYWWSAMYQGRPTPDEGGIFDRADFRYFEMRGGIARVRGDNGLLAEYDSASCRKAIYVDLAVSEKQTADYTVAMEVWVTPEGQILIMDVTRRRIPGPQQADFLQMLHRGMTLKIEAIGYQTALIQELQRRGVPVEPVHPDKDKVTRASAAGAQYRARKVFHLQGADWQHDFESELLAFPAGEHDDQVDALAYAARDLLMMVAPHRVRQRSRGDTITGGLMEMRF